MARDRRVTLRRECGPLLLEDAMDVLYYWKDYESDIRQGRIGYFRSANDKLEELRQRSPDDIWVVKTPRGCKGQLQLLGRLVWSDSPTTKVMAAPGESLIHYRPDDPRSVWFDEGVSHKHVDEVVEARSELTRGARAELTHP